MAFFVSALTSCQSSPVIIQKSQLDMVLVKAGSFMMGSDEHDESPPRAVTISRDFLILEHELSISQLLPVYNWALAQTLAVIEEDGIYLANGPRLLRLPHEHLVLEDNQIRPIADAENKPVVNISWYGAAAWCNWKSEEDQLRAVFDLDTWQASFSANGYRLPSEAEWEYAARGAQFAKATEDDLNKQLDEHAWTYNNSPDGVMPVALKKPNRLGLYDILGNVWEWVFDYYAPYPSKQLVDPLGPARGSTTVFRGGAWGNPQESARVSSRNGYSDRSWCDNSVGFRPVRTAKAPD